MLLSHIKFYIQNICKMRKTRIEVKTNIILHIDAQKIARVATNNLRNMIIDITDSNNKANIDFANINLIKFRIYIKILLANSVQKTGCKCIVENYTNSDKIKVIVLLIINLKSENTNYIEDFLLIHYCQVAEFDYPNIGNINNINKDIMLLWQDIIHWSGQLLEEKIDTNCIQDQSSQLNHYNAKIGILELIFDEMEISEEFSTKIEKDCLDKNLQAIILYNII